MGLIAAVILMRCPRCRRGGVYSGLLRTREHCPTCGLAFEREPGYYTGAMYASYFLGIGLTLPVWMTMLVAGAPYWLILAVSVPLVLLLMPLTFHYSRVLWLHIDYRVNPRTFDDSEAKS